MRTAASPPIAGSIRVAIVYCWTRRCENSSREGYEILRTFDGDGGGRDRACPQAKLQECQQEPHVRSETLHCDVISVTHENQ
jgi:hypothetical protein